MPNDDDDVHRLMDYERLICWIRTPQEKSSVRERERKTGSKFKWFVFYPRCGGSNDLVPTCVGNGRPRPLAGLDVTLKRQTSMPLPHFGASQQPSVDVCWFFFRRGRRRCRVSSIKSHLSNHSRSVMSIKTDLDSLTDTRRRRPRCPAWRFFVWVG